MSQDDDVYLVWSNEHDGWWANGRFGYSRALPRADRYTRAEALEICRQALPTAMHLGRIAEIPVRLADIAEVLRDQPVPDAVVKERWER